MNEVECPKCEGTISFYGGDIHIDGGTSSVFECPHCENEVRIGCIVSYDYEIVDDDE